MVAITNGTANTLTSLADLSVDTGAGERQALDDDLRGSSSSSARSPGCSGTPPGEALERLATDAELAAVAIERLLGDADLPSGWCRGWASARRW